MKRLASARLDREFVEALSYEKNEPAWMRAHRLRCLSSL
jgi:hypothetical protein